MTSAAEKSFDGGELSLATTFKARNSPLVDLRSSSEILLGQATTLSCGAHKRRRIGHRVTSQKCSLRHIQLEFADRRRPYSRTGKSLAAASFSYYIKPMSAGETINGVAITDEQIQRWAEEAEAGYDVQALKRRGRGRPGRGAEPSQVVALRLTAEELASIDAAAAREHKTRSELIREALAKYAV